MFGVQHFEFQYFWGVSEKQIFFGYEGLTNILGHYKTGLFLGGISMHFRAFFLMPKNRMGIFFGVAKTSKYILGMSYRYHKLRKTFSKFYRRFYDLLST